MNGVDVSRLQVGDVIELTEDRAQMMIEQGWAEAIAPSPGTSPLESQTAPRHPN